MKEMMDKFNSINESDDSKIYSITMKTGNRYSIYNGYLVVNSECENNIRVMGYINQIKNIGVDEYLIDGKYDNDTLNVKFISPDKKFKNRNLIFKRNEENNYICSEENYNMSVKKINYDHKKIDKTKRKILNYEYDLSNK